MGTKTAAANFVSTLAQKKPKTHLPWLMGRLVEVRGDVSNGQQRPVCCRGALQGGGVLVEMLESLRYR